MLRTRIVVLPTAVFPIRGIPLHSKMVVPILTPRVEQLGDLVRLRIDARQVRSFVQIAIDAGKGEIVEAIGPTMNLRDDMLDMKCGQR